MRTASLREKRFRLAHYSSLDIGGLRGQLFLALAKDCNLCLLQRVAGEFEIAGCSAKLPVNFHYFCVRFRLDSACL